MLSEAQRLVSVIVRRCTHQVNQPTTSHRPCFAYSPPPHIQTHPHLTHRQVGRFPSSQKGHVTNSTSHLPHNLKMTCNPVTLPLLNPTQSYWQTPPDPELADHRTTPDLPAGADTVIIGSGITGAAVAWHLLRDTVPVPVSDGAAPGNQPGTEHSATGRKIVMLEARQACSGATGRNGISSDNIPKVATKTRTSSLTLLQEATPKPPPT